MQYKTKYMNFCVKLIFYFFVYPVAAGWGPVAPQNENDASFCIRHIVCFRRQKKIKIFLLEFWRSEIISLNFADFSHVLYERYDVSNFGEPLVPNRRLGVILKKIIFRNFLDITITKFDKNIIINSGKKYGPKVRGVFLSIFLETCPKNAKTTLWGATTPQPAATS